MWNLIKFLKKFKVQLKGKLWKVKTQENGIITLSGWNITRYSIIYYTIVRTINLIFSLFIINLWVFFCTIWTPIWEFFSRENTSYFLSKLFSIVYNILYILYIYSYKRYIYIYKRQMNKNTKKKIYGKLQFYLLSINLLIAFR